MARARNNSGDPAETDIKYDVKLVTYIKYFKHDKLLKIAEENQIYIDESKLEKEGKLCVVSFENQGGSKQEKTTKSNDKKKVPPAQIKHIREFFAGVKKNMTEKTITLNYVTKGVAEKEWHNIVNLGKKYQVLIMFEERKLLVYGESKPASDSKKEIENLLKQGPSTEFPNKNMANRPKSAFVPLSPRGNVLNVAKTRRKSYSENSGTDSYPIKDMKGLDIGPIVTQNGISQHYSSAGYTHVRTGVHVCPSVTDITQMAVDGVVNAANSQLQHAGGVALAIAKAAGPTLTRECKAFIKRNRQLDVSNTCVTTAGNMNAKKVIHTVGPIWGHGTDQTCMRLLQNTFHNVLHTADTERLATLAIPGISSGYYGMPLNLVAKIAVNSITDYLEKSKNTRLTNIFLVGMDSSLISYLESELDVYVKNGDYRSNSRPPIGAEAADSIPTFPSRHKPQNHTHQVVMAAPNDIQQDSQYDNCNKNFHGNNSNLHDDSNDDDDCCICMCPVVNPKTLPRCKHTFCTDCIDRGFKVKPACPVCGEIYGQITGDQPKDGRMDVSRNSRQSLPGYRGCGVIVINYSFPSGTQTADMASPGQSYSGTHRTAYLPDNSEGNKVLKLLHRAFQARLIFTVGRSRTTGADNTVTWNDIHHKTNIKGGPQMFGYPDPTYLDRVQDELAVKGIK